MLAGKLPLHDVRDAEALAVRVVSTSRLNLSWHEREDLTAYLIATAWELSTRYEPGGRTSFSTWATTTLRLRTIDWVRASRGRTVWKFAGSTHERQRPQILSLDATYADLNGARIDETDKRDPLVDTLPAGAGDPQEDCGANLAWLLDARSSSRAGDLATLGLPPPRRAA